jgi:hypothetical protein
VVTIKIQNEYPELIKYLNEIPEHLPSNKNDGVANKDLKDYLNSLNDLLATYSAKHLANKIGRN